MAYVAISNELESTVRDGIRAMARRELDTIGEVPRLKGTESFVEQALWGAHAHLKSQIPADWKQKADRIILRINFAEGAWQETVFLQAEQEAPPRYNIYSVPKAILSHDDPDAAAIVTIVSNRRDAQKRWKAVEDQVMQFLANCKSLNEGLKLWPDLRMYIPKHFLDRVERKAERQKNSGTAALDVLKNMDTDQIVAAAVIARMSTGKAESDT